MAVEKRPAEKAAATRIKKARTFKQAAVGSPDSDSFDHHESQEAGDQSQAIDADKLSKEFSGKVDRLAKELRARQHWSEQFKEKVKGEQDKLEHSLEQAETEFLKKQEDFRQSMIPPLAMLFKDLDLNKEAEIKLPFEIENMKTSSAEKRACRVISDCEALIEVYDNLCELPSGDHPVCKARDVFTRDKAEVVKAFGAAKKLTINRLQAELHESKDEMHDKFELGQEELRIAQRIVDQNQSEVPRRQDGCGGIGSMLYAFDKIVGGLQDLVGR